MNINEVSKWFLRNFASLAGFFGDKGIITQKNISISDLEKVAHAYRFEYIDCGDNFVLSQSRFCK